MVTLTHLCTFSSSAVHSYSYHSFCCEGVNESLNAWVSASAKVGSYAPRNGSGDKVLDLLLRADWLMLTVRLGMAQWDPQLQSWLGLNNRAQDALDPS